MATRAAIAGVGVAALVTLGLAAGFAHAQTSAPLRLGDVVLVSPPASGSGTPSRTVSPAPRKTVRPVPAPRPPSSDDDDEIDDDADD
ncbi:hypothetical protein [Actinomadura sp. BRA 177]|uniref:hypothetical protein n=1 Tax=Actinomadura sp. BRA 177 TaxID=2745202 RepID=UPI0015952F2A|nr:hypothetical protein [Actinomadura sp. BRA 177]NVI92926.1 hypothetical protein [Actinomadura sp. BRA 177]